MTLNCSTNLAVAQGACEKRLSPAKNHEHAENKVVPNRIADMKEIMTEQKHMRAEELELRKWELYLDKQKVEEENKYRELACAQQSAIFRLSQDNYG